MITNPRRGVIIKNKSDYVKLTEIALKHIQEETQDGRAYLVRFHGLRQRHGYEGEFLEQVEYKAVYDVCLASHRETQIGECVDGSSFSEENVKGFDDNVFQDGMEFESTGFSITGQGWIFRRIK